MTGGDRSIPGCSIEEIWNINNCPKVVAVPCENVLFVIQETTNLLSKCFALWINARRNPEI